MSIAEWEVLRGVIQVGEDFCLLAEGLCKIGCKTRVGAEGANFRVTVRFFHSKLEHLPREL